MTIGKIIVWPIIGALSGTLAGRLVTFSKQGFGFWESPRPARGGRRRRVFWLFVIDLVLGEIKITVEDLISAFVGSMLCLGAWWLIRKTARRMSRSQNLETSPKQACRHAGDISPACFAVSCSMRFPQVSRTHRTAALGALASEDDCHDLS